MKAIIGYIFPRDKKTKGKTNDSISTSPAILNLKKVTRQEHAQIRCSAYDYLIN